MSVPELVPSYWASVSGGKDSLYMLRLILANPVKYPLDGVVHFELEIDYPFIKNVIDYMEQECKTHGIRFVRIKPGKSWLEWYHHRSTKTGKQYGFPTRRARWCNDKYKLDAALKLENFMKTVGKRVVYYIGFCADESKRFTKNAGFSEVYPLSDMGIYENTILEWARTQPIFNNYYVVNDRCGCMWCPMASRINYAYLAKYYPDCFRDMLVLMRDTENIRKQELGRDFSCISSNPKYNADYLERVIYEKWLPILEERENDWRANNAKIHSKF